MQSSWFAHTESRWYNALSRALQCAMWIASCIGAALIGALYYVGWAGIEFPTGKRESEMARENGTVERVEVSEVVTRPMESAGVRASNPNLPSYTQRGYQGNSEQSYTSVVSAWVSTMNALGGKVSLVKFAPDGAVSMFVDWVQP